MPKDQKEPQSYGSQQDWVTGKTGETVSDPSGQHDSTHDDFYESRRDSEGNGPHQGGSVSPVQAAENRAMAAHGSGESKASPAPKVATADGGAKRDSFFRERDYK